jgi:hypothetical protein
MNDNTDLNGQLPMNPLYPKTAASPAQIQNPSDGLSGGFVVSEPKVYRTPQRDLKPTLGIFKLYSVLAELKAPCFGLWSYVRGLDRRGSGWFIVDVAVTCVHLECSESTFRSWLKSGMGVWFIKADRLNKNEVRIHYRSIENLCKEFSLFELGAVGFVSYKALTRSGRKVVAAELEIAMAQHQAYYATRKKLAGSDRDRIQNPAKIVHNRSSALVQGVTRGRRFLVIRHDATQIPHTTIGKLALRLNRSPSTAQRRLSNINRVEKGFEPLDRLQILRRFDEPQTIAYDRFSAFHNSKRLGENPNIPGSRQRVIRYGGDYCWAGGNIYNPQVELKCCKVQRKRIREAVKASNSML